MPRSTEPLRKVLALACRLQVAAASRITLRNKKYFRCKICTSYTCAVLLCNICRWKAPPRREELVQILPSTLPRTATSSFYIHLILSLVTCKFFFVSHFQISTLKQFPKIEFPKSPWRCRTVVSRVRRGKGEVSCHDTCIGSPSGRRPHPGSGRT